MLRLDLLRETFANISYSVLISVMLIILLFIAKLFDGWIHDICVLVSYTIVGKFLLTLLMILKRVHVLLTKEATR